jgi:hypothetical protein
MKFILKSLLSISAVALMLSTQAIADVSCVSNHKGVVTGGLMLDLDGAAYTEIDDKKTPLTGKYTCTVYKEEVSGGLRLPHGWIKNVISKPYIQKWTAFEHHSIDGKLTGLQTTWYSNGKKLSQVNLINSKGLMTWWYPTGEKAAQVNVYIAASKLPGLSMAYQNLMGYYQMEGDYKSWYRNGNQSVTGTFNDGELEVKVLPWWQTWTEVVETSSGTYIYIDVNTIREHNDYVYYWILNDAAVPMSGNKSSKFYKQGDCGMNRFKILSMVVYNQSMANGNKEDLGGMDKWVHPEPDNTARTLLDYACNYVK